MGTVAVIEKVGGHWTVEMGGVLVGTRRNETAARHLATANGAGRVAVRETLTRVAPPAATTTEPPVGWAAWEREMST